MWVAETVKIALVEAFRIDDIIGGNWKPRGEGSPWPAYLKTSTDYNENVDLHEAGGAYWSEQAQDRRSKLMRKRIATTEEIRHMEICLLGRPFEGKDIPMWIGGLLEGNNGPRNCIEAFAVHTARAMRCGRKFNENKFCRRVGWNYETYKSRRERGAEIIAFKLNQIGIPSWLNDGDPYPPRQAKGRPPVADALLVFISERPRTRAQCISYAVTHGLIESRETNHSIKVALTALVKQRRVMKDQSGLFSLVA